MFTVSEVKSYTYNFVVPLIEAYKNIGVRYRKNKYEAYLSDKGKYINLGTWDSKKDAEQAVYCYAVGRFVTNVCLYSSEEKLSEIMPTKFLGYFASPLGEIYNKQGLKLSGSINKGGYRQIAIQKKNIEVHRIVAQTFIPNPDNLPCINHKDGNKLNNNINNLEWCTYSYNTKHAYNTGLERKILGEKHHNHKLTEEEVRYIKLKYQKRHKKFGAVPLSKRFNVDRTTITDIVNGKTWREVQ